MADRRRLHITSETDSDEIDSPAAVCRAKPDKDHNYHTTRSKKKQALDSREPSLSILRTSSTESTKPKRSRRAPTKRPKRQPVRCATTNTLSSDKVKRSSIWNHFQKGQGRESKICKICESEIKGTNTSNAWSHMRNHHMDVLESEDSSELSDSEVENVEIIVVNGPTNESDFDQQDSFVNAQNSNSIFEARPIGKVVSEQIESVPSTSHSHSQSQGKAENVNNQFRKVLNGKVEKAKGKKLKLKAEKSLYPPSSEKSKRLTKILLKMIVTDFQPFSIVNDKGFIEYSRALNHRYKLPSDTHLRTKVLLECYNTAFQKVSDELSKVSDIAITFDSWTNINHLSFIGVTGHFLNESFELMSTSLKLLHTGDLAHTGKNIAQLLDEEILHNFKGKIVSAVTDNGPNVVAATTELQINHLSCFAHTLQLVINSAIAATATDEDDTIETFALQRRKKPSVETFTEEEEEAITKILKTDELPSHGSVFSIILKCRKIVAYLNSSSKATALLKKVLKQKGHNYTCVIQDVITRWFSSLKMLRRIEEIYESIHIIASKIVNFPELLTAQEIEALSEIVKLLSPFEKASTYLSASSYPSCSMIIPTVKGLIRNLDEIGDTIKSPIVKTFHHHLKTSCNRLKEYEKRTVTQLATLLDPRFKEEGFIVSENYRNAVSVAKNEIKRIFQEHFPSSTDANEEDENNIEEVEIPTFFQFLSPNKKESTRNKANNYMDTIAVLNGYIAASNEPFRTNPITFWANKEQTILRQIALKFLIVPATSVPAECLFSVASYTQGNRRNRLSPDSLEKIVFLNRNSTYF